MGYKYEGTLEEILSLKSCTKLVYSDFKEIGIEAIRIENILNFKEKISKKEILNIIDFLDYKMQFVRIKNLSNLCDREFPLPKERTFQNALH